MLQLGTILCVLCEWCIVEVVSKRMGVCVGMRVYVCVRADVPACVYVRESVSVCVWVRVVCASVSKCCVA